MSRGCLAALCVSVAGLLLPLEARGHDLNTALLGLEEVGEGVFRLTWESSSNALAEDTPTPAVFPAPCRLVGGLLDCGRQGLVGAIDFPWLAGGETEVMVAIDWRNGQRLVRVVNGKSPSLAVYGIPSSAGLRFLAPVARDYTRLGIGHILTGYDHLLFVLALGILLRGGRRLVAAVTAFTLAHSLTLALSVLGLLRLPAPPVEAVIALSIVLVCAECVRPGTSLVRRAPWIVTFAFGTLHGLGFASALLAVGLPERHLPSALLFFNLGVELGQLGVLAASGVLRLFVMRLGWTHARLRLPLVYTMGGLAACWSIQRIVVVLGG